MDFTIKTYKQLLESLDDGTYSFQTVSCFLEQAADKAILLRHDVEKHYNNALELAQIQNSHGAVGTYYFRFSKRHFNENVIAEIAKLGHEIGYHYDDLAQCKGDYKKAIKRFEKNLNILRNIAPVNTICMDGSPLSKHDNKHLWKKYDYHDFDIISEPYFDINFDEVMYLTDTGRRWDGEKVSVRDKVSKNNEYRISNIEKRKSTQNSTPNTQNLSFHSTNDIIAAANNKHLPDQLMITFHPQRWTDKPLPWMKELVWQNLKNQVKRLIIK